MRITTPAEIPPASWCHGNRQWPASVGLVAGRPARAGRRVGLGLAPALPRLALGQCGRRWHGISRPALRRWREVVEVALGNEMALYQ
jgi:hypothetical protein